jgi:phosphate starvation-inducible protein PhoH
MLYNNRHWHDNVDDPDKYRKKDEVLDEDAETTTLKIEFDVLFQYYEDRVKVTLSNPEFDGELTFETTTANKARQILDDLEQGENEDKAPVKAESPKAVPPVSYRIEPSRQTVQPQPRVVQNSTSVQQVTKPVEVDVQSTAQAQLVELQKQANPFFSIASDIAEIVRLGSELKPKIDRIRDKG